ncbi:conserved membrane protein of unknown function [Tepidanaerobacter acetatoxydans Re1]|uniref:DUF1538 domain-containing protein n=1 Tax=Tepidanaerobacter acetatoxydans (strain DSM 21804 / JCM 16047 / Re1) TaxID=1209989 RepID=F4LUL1_TEPAE|nr:DUF1538 domain-containing protein [Tepidanaerobacter acetatoxydans]AEE92656.1 protein of unknown function DUF1538 [Tepidanaerobacter acetatoxydans Re1]CDI41068.1 conserved membrane protein of unknown function [Tepidanaerobacter acetatoxydans Re1]
MSFFDVLKAFWETAKNVLPIVIFLCIFRLIVLRKPIEEIKTLALGTLLSIIGLHLFLKGISLSLIPLGDSVGRDLVVLNNKYLIAIFAFVVGFFATMVEPGLKSLALEVEEISTGAIPMNVLINAVGIGFGLGMSIGIVKILNNIPTKTILFPVLLLAMILGYFAPREFVDIAIDSASATTGPVNIPLNMAIALGLSKILETSDPLLNGFGIIGLTSMGAVISVLALGILSRI